MNIANKHIENYKVGDIVNLPLGEVGLIEAIEPGILEYDYACKIIMATISDLGGVGLYHENDLSPVDFRSTKAKSLLIYATQLITYFSHQVQESQQIELDIEYKLREVRINIANLNTQLKFFNYLSDNKSIISLNIDRKLKIQRAELKELLQNKFKKSI